VEDWEVPYVFFGTFDGHAGSGCAVAAANELHQVVHKRLMASLHHLVPDATARGAGTMQAMWFASRDISADSLIIGALEAAFWEMDQQIGEDKKRYKMLGGCTAIISLFILGKLYVANAGDSRGVLCRARTPYPVSFDFTPVSERQRLQQLGFQKPQLLGNEYTHLDYCRRPMRKDVGKLMLYRDAHMTGWSYKEITPEDLKFPVVYGEGKRSRLLATIGVTRGFGDHDLRAQSQNGYVMIKPFLTPQPEVRVLDLESENVGDADVLVMATDGLWDVVSNDRVAEIVHAGLVTYEDADESRKRYRFVAIAQDLVMAARGKLIDRNWKRVQGDVTSAATIDDISVLVIPLLAYKREYEEWREGAERRRAARRAAKERASAVSETSSSEGGQETASAEGAVANVAERTATAEATSEVDLDDDGIEEAIEAEVGSAPIGELALSEEVNGDDLFGDDDVDPLVADSK